MAAPFCRICKDLGDTEGRMSREAFPRGIPEAVYPYGCVRFMPRLGSEEMARRWQKLEKKGGVAEAILEKDWPGPRSG